MKYCEVLSIKNYSLAMIQLSRQINETLSITADTTYSFSKYIKYKLKEINEISNLLICLSCELIIKIDPKLFQNIKLSRLSPELDKYFKPCCAQPCRVSLTWLDFNDLYYLTPVCPKNILAKWNKDKRMKLIANVKKGNYKAVNCESLLDYKKIVAELL